MQEDTLRTEQQPLGDLTPYPCAYECTACRKTGRIVHVYLRVNDPFPPCPLCGDRTSWAACSEDSL